MGLDFWVRSQRKAQAGDGDRGGFRNKRRSRGGDSKAWSMEGMGRGTEESTSTEWAEKEEPEGESRKWGPQEPREESSLKSGCQLVAVGRGVRGGWRLTGYCKLAFGTFASLLQGEHRPGARAKGRR